MNIKQVILDEMNRQGLSARQLAHLAGLRERGVQMYIEGIRNVGSEWAGKLLEAMGITLKLPPKKRG